ncbi:MAG: hypothetical protein ACYTF3_06435, partial [Planctomycetota bacterium]
MSRARQSLLPIATIALTALAGCGDLTVAEQSCDTNGVEGCPCYVNATCDDGLTCVSDRCVSFDGCPPGSVGCPCGEGVECDPGLQCEADADEPVCIFLCALGQEGCD